MYPGSKKKMKRFSLIYVVFVTGAGHNDCQSTRIYGNSCAQTHHRVSTFENFMHAIQFIVSSALSTGFASHQRKKLPTRKYTHTDRLCLSGCFSKLILFYGNQKHFTWRGCTCASSSFSLPSSLELKSGIFFTGSNIIKNNNYQMTLHGREHLIQHFHQRSLFNVAISFPLCCLQITTSEIISNFEFHSLNNSKVGSL